MISPLAIFVSRSHGTRKPTIGATTGTPTNALCHTAVDATTVAVPIDALTIWGNVPITATGDERTVEPTVAKGKVIDGISVTVTGSVATPHALVRPPALGRVIRGDPVTPTGITVTAHRGSKIG